MGEYLTQVVDFARILGGFGLITIALAILRRWTERRRWSRFQRQTALWLEDLEVVGIAHPKEYSNDDWRAICELNLTQSGFTPTETDQLLDVAIIVSKRIATERYLL